MPGQAEFTDRDDLKAGYMLVFNDSVYYASGVSDSIKVSHQFKLFYHSFCDCGRCATASEDRTDFGVVRKHF